MVDIAISIEVMGNDWHRRKFPLMAEETKISFPCQMKFLLFLRQIYRNLLEILMTLLLPSVYSADEFMRIHQHPHQILILTQLEYISH